MRWIDGCPGYPDIRFMVYCVSMFCEVAVAIVQSLWLLEREVTGICVGVVLFGGGFVRVDGRWKRVRDLARPRYFGSW